MDYLNLIILISKKIEIEFSLTQSKKFRTRIFTYVFRTMKFQIAFVVVLSQAFLLSEGIKICLNQYENIFQEFSGLIKARKQARGLDLTKKIDGDLSKINSGHYARVFESVMKGNYDRDKLLPYLGKFLDRDGVDPNFVITDLDDENYKGLNLVHALVTAIHQKRLRGQHNDHPSLKATQAQPLAVLLTLIEKYNFDLNTSFPNMHGFSVLERLVRALGGHVDNSPQPHPYRVEKDVHLAGVVRRLVSRGAHPTTDILEYVANFF